MPVSIRKIAFAAIVAAFYAALTIVIAPISYGPIQFRIAEALCILPFFFPITSLGLFIGCLIANLFSPYSFLDITAGSAATLAAALITMRLGSLKVDTIAVKILACLPPVLLNALVIGAVIAWSITGGGEAFLPAFVVNALQVGAGQLVVLYALGFPLLIYLPKSHIYTQLSEQYNKR